MRPATNIARWVVRITGPVLVLLGLAFWLGYARRLVPLHMALGGLFDVGLLAIVVAALVAGARRGLAVLGLVWVLLPPGLGMAQMSLLPGPSHWIIRVVHLLVGLAAMGIADRLTRAVLGSRRPAADAVVAERVA